MEQISYIVYVKLTAKVHLKPTPEQAELLLQTMREANSACDRISAWAWENRTWGQYKIHHGTLTLKLLRLAQVVVRCISKALTNWIENARQFRPLGAITYGSIASVWTVKGRQKIPYVTGGHHAKLFQIWPV